MIRSLRYSSTLLTLLAVVSSAPSTSLAQVVYDNGTPDNSGGLPITSPWSTANDFTLSRRTQLSNVDWYALILGNSGPSPVTASFFWKIFQDIEGRPGTLIAHQDVTGAQGTLVNAYGCCEPQPWEYQAYAFTTSLNNLTLGAGTYWLAIGHFDSEYGTNYYWANSQQGYGNESKRRDNTGWHTYPNEGAFTIYGNSDVNTVPEPASLALLATGLGGLGGFRRWAKRRKLR